MGLNGVKIESEEVVQPVGCTHPAEAKNLAASDVVQLQFGTAQQRTVLTHNRRDYERLHQAALREHRPHAGILIASRRASDFDLARRVMNVLNTFTAEEVVNQLLYF